MSTQSGLIASRNAIKNQIKKKLKYFLDSFHGDRSIPALKELEKINDRAEVDMGLTTLANNIFIRSQNDISSEKYKDILKRLDLDSCYYEVNRYLHNDQYEQAVILAINKFEALSKQTYIDNEKLAVQLKLHNLLVLASERNDTHIVIDLMNKLGDLNLITHQNRAFLLSLALQFKNEEIICRLLEFVQAGTFQDFTLFQICDCLIEKEKFEEALTTIPRIQSSQLRTLVCLKYIASFPTLEMFHVMNNLYNDGCLVIECDDLPAEYLSISGLRDFELLSELCSNLLPTMAIEMKQLFLFSIFSSINNKDVPIDSSIFVLNCCKNHKEGLTEKHKDIIFQQLSKYPLKITSIKLYQHFQSNGFEITVSNFHQLIASHMSGTEIDTALYLLVEYLDIHKKFSDSFLLYLKNLSEFVPDPRLDAFFSNKSLHELKDIINYDYIAAHIENERDRSRIDFKLPKGFKQYSYQEDNRNAQFFTG